MVLFNKKMFEGIQFTNETTIEDRIKIIDELIDKVGDDQKDLLINEKRLIEIGYLGEKNVIYELKYSKQDMLVLHDITIPGLVDDSQIDFVLLTKSCIIVLETKKLTGNIEISGDGIFTRIKKNANGTVYNKEAMYSPFTQNEHHIDSLRKLLDDNKISNRINIVPLVVIASDKSYIDMRYAKSEVKEKIIRRDMLNKKIDEIVELNSKKCIVSDKTNLEINEILLKNNKPREYDYIKKFNLKLKEPITKPVIEDKKKENKVTSEPKHEISDDRLYEELKQYRIDKSKEKKLPLHYIYSNEEMEELILKLPSNKEEFINVKGFGEKKYEWYGEEIISILNKYRNTEPVDSLKEEVEENNSNLADDPLYKKLRSYRFNKAKEFNVEAYMIFNNKVLEELVNKKPKNKEELIAIEGFGQQKFYKYGFAVLDIINKKADK